MKKPSKERTAYLNDLLDKLGPKQQKVTQAPPPITPLSGGGSSAPFKSRRSAPEERRVDWSVWRHIPEVEIWKAVALSLDIDPRKVDRSHSRNLHANSDDAPKEFADRLLVATSNHELVPRTIVNLGDREDWQVSLSQFATWALSIEWKLPDELEAMEVIADNDPQLRDMQEARDRIKDEGGRLSARRVAEVCGYDRNGLKFKRRWELIKRPGSKQPKR